MLCPCTILGSSVVTYKCHLLPIFISYILISGVYAHFYFIDINLFNNLLPKKASMCRYFQDNVSIVF